MDDKLTKVALTVDVTYCLCMCSGVLSINHSNILFAFKGKFKMTILLLLSAQDVQMSCFKQELSFWCIITQNVLIILSIPTVFTA